MAVAPLLIGAKPLEARRLSRLVMSEHEVTPLLVGAKPLEARTLLRRRIGGTGALVLRDVDHGGLLALLARVEWLTMLAYLYGNGVCAAALASRWCYRRLRSIDNREARGLWRFFLRRDFSQNPPGVQLLQQQRPCTVAHLMRAITAAEAECFSADGSETSPPLAECKCSPGVAVASPLAEFVVRRDAVHEEPQRCARCGAWSASAARVDRTRRWLNECIGFAASRPPTERDIALCHELVESLWVCCALAREARGALRDECTASDASLLPHASTRESLDGSDARAQEMAVFDVEAGRSSELAGTLGPSEPLCRAYSDLVAVYTISKRASARRRAKMALSARRDRGLARYWMCCIPMHCGSTALPFALFPFGALAWLLWGAVVAPPTLRLARRGEIDGPRLFGSGALPNHTLSSAATAMLLLPAVATLLCALALACVAAPIRWLCNTPRDSRVRRACVRLCGDRSDWYDASELLFIEILFIEDPSLRGFSRNLDRPTHTAFSNAVLPRGRHRARHADAFWRSGATPSALFPIPQCLCALPRRLFACAPSSGATPLEAAAESMSTSDTALALFALGVLPLVAAKVQWYDAVSWSAPFAPLVAATIIARITSQWSQVKRALSRCETDEDARASCARILCNDMCRSRNPTIFGRSRLPLSLRSRLRPIARRGAIGSRSKANGEDRSKANGEDRARVRRVQHARRDAEGAPREGLRS